MKILLMNAKNDPIVVYHQDYRIIDHYVKHTIDVISDKNHNNILFSYSYTGAEISWEENPLTEEREAKVIYRGIEPAVTMDFFPSGNMGDTDFEGVKFE